MITSKCGNDNRELIVGLDRGLCIQRIIVCGYTIKIPGRDVHNVALVHISLGTGGRGFGATMDQERRPESDYEWLKITSHIDYPTRGERGVKNTLICTVMRGDIGLYENFEKYAKVQANEVQSTIHIEC